MSQSVEIEWIHKCGNSRFDLTREVTTTTTGDVISYGYFTNTVDFDPSSGVNEITSQSAQYDSTDLFVQITP